MSLFVATDGAATKNGTANCRASYGFCIINSADMDTIWKVCESIPKTGARAATINKLVKDGVIDSYESYEELIDDINTPTNNRAELMAFLKALETIEKEELTGNIIWISDSEYSQKSVDEWSRKWIKEPKKMAGKANLDLILPIQQKIDELRKQRSVKLVHVNSHIDMPARPDQFKDLELSSWLSWFLNHRVDLGCTEIIATNSSASGSVTKK